MTTQLRAGRGVPDIIALQDFDAPKYYKMPLADLSACMKPYASDFPESKIKAASRPNGRFQAVPWDAGPMQLVYRKDMFEKYRIDPATLTTWPAYIAAGQKLVQASGGKVHMAMSCTLEPPTGIESTVHDFRAFMQENGGNLFDANGNPTFAAPKNIQALELVRQFRTSGISTLDLTSESAVGNVLNTGSVATILTPAWGLGTFKTLASKTAGKWGAVPLPAFPGSNVRSSNEGGTSFAIPEQSKNKHAAWAFLRWRELTVAGREAAFKAENGGFESIFAPAANSPLINAPDPFLAPPGNEWFKNGAELSKNIPPVNTTERIAFFDDAFNAKVPDYLKGKISAEQFLTEVQRAVMAQ